MNELERELAAVGLTLPRARPLSALDEARDE